jgi:hypothetical protein
MNKITPEVENAIDRICGLGCEVVESYIDALKKGESRNEYGALDEAQRTSLLAELQSIMNVYLDKGS